MKTSLDPRHKSREIVVKNLFRWSFQEKQAVKDKLAQKIIKKIKQVDKIVRDSASEWPIEQINKADLAILRLAIYELVIDPKEPPKVIIDEAIELAKTFGSEKSASFINGVLGTVYKNVKKKKD